MLGREGCWAATQAQEEPGTPAPTPRAQGLREPRARIPSPNTAQPLTPATSRPTGMWAVWRALRRPRPLLPPCLWALADTRAGERGQAGRLQVLAPRPPAGLLVSAEAPSLTKRKEKPLGLAVTHFSLSPGHRPSHQRDGGRAKDNFLSSAKAGERGGWKVTACPETRTGTRHRCLRTSALAEVLPVMKSPQTHSHLPSNFLPAVAAPRRQAQKPSGSLCHGSLQGPGPAPARGQLRHVEQRAQSLRPICADPTLRPAPSCMPKAGSPSALGPSPGSPGRVVPCQRGRSHSTCSPLSSPLPAAPSAAAGPSPFRHSGQPALSSPKPPSLPGAAPARAGCPAPSWPSQPPAGPPAPLSASAGKPGARPWADGREWGRS